MSNTNNNLPLTLGMQKLINELKEIVANPFVEAAFNNAIANAQPILLDGILN